MALTPGTRLGPYEILSALGAGGMGEVYRARDTKLNREVAIKSLPDLFASDAERLARFTREAQTLASLKRVHRFTPQTFAADLRRSKAVLEQTSGVEVFGYRAPTFSVVRQTAWAIDVIAECGLIYDSSIFPVRHDRYGIPDAPRTPFIAVGKRSEILELPPATWRIAGQNLPVAGGGYFRLFPLMIMKAGLSQLRRKTKPAMGMTYFHPWEFDVDQPKLPLKALSKWRTYVGIHKSFRRLEHLLKLYPFRRAIDIVRDLEPQRSNLPRFTI